MADVPFQRPPPEEEALLRARAEALANGVATPSFARDVSEGGVPHVAFACQGTRYLIEAARVAVALPWSAMRACAPVPGVPRERVMLCDLRGRVVPVFRFPTAAPRVEGEGARAGEDDPARILVFEDAEGAFGVRVDVLEDVVAFPPAAIRPLPPGLFATPDALSEARKGMGPGEAIVLSVDALVSGPWFRLGPRAPHDAALSRTSRHARSHEETPWA